MFDSNRLKPPLLFSPKLPDFHSPFSKDGPLRTDSESRTYYSTFSYYSSSDSGMNYELPPSRSFLFAPPASPVRISRLPFQWPVSPASSRHFDGDYRFYLVRFCSHFPSAFFFHLSDRPRPLITIQECAYQESYVLLSPSQPNPWALHRAA